MIIYGVREKFFKAFEVSQEKCGNCGNDQSVLYLFCKYVHIYWIPVFPFKKVARLECQHCKAVKDEAEMTDQEKVLTENLKRSSKYPKKYFALTIIIILLFVMPIFGAIIGGIVTAFK